MERTTIPAPTGAIPAWTAGAGRRAIVLLQEVFGVTPWIRRVGDRLADRGFAVLAPEVFHRAEPGFEAPYDADGLQRGRALLAALDRDAFRADAGAARAHLVAQGAERVAVLGWCMGGLLSWEAHAAHPFDAAVVYYGARMTLAGPDGARPVDRAGTMRGPVLCHYGADDPSIPPDMVAEVARALAAAKLDSAIRVHRGAGHGFACEDRPDHVPGASAAAWAETLAFLDRHLPG
jgi:carboxymethylenebutenolidase